MKRKKTLSIIISSYDDINNPVYSGGGAWSVHQLAKRLAKKYKIRILTGTYKNAKNEVIDNIEYIRVGSCALGHKIGQLIYQLALLKYAAWEKYDLWMESSTPPFTFSLLPLVSKKPVIIWINMLCSYDMQRKYKINVAPIEHWLGKLYGHVIAPTGWVKNEIIAINRKAKIYTITHGYDDKPTKLNLNKIKKLRHYLLFIGRIEVNQKGLDLLLQTLPFTGQETKIVVAGSGSKKEEDKLTALIAKYDITKKVIRVGKVQGQEKEILLKYAKAVVIPSRFETFSMSALESITHQKPVICFDIPQLKWIPIKYAYKINPYNLEELAICIDNIFASKIKKNISGREKTRILKKFNWVSSTRQFEACFSQVAI